MVQQNSHFKVKPGANELVAQLLKKDSVQAFYKGIKDEIENNYRIYFFNHFQCLVTKVGLILSKAIISNSKYQISYYYKSISYICHKIIDDNNLFIKLLKYNINGNKIKHTIDDIYGEIKPAVTLYNELINKIIAKTKITAFNAILFKDDYVDYYRNLYKIKPVQQNTNHQNSSVNKSNTIAQHRAQIKKDCLSVLNREVEELNKKISTKQAEFKMVDPLKFGKRKALNNEIKLLNDDLDSLIKQIAIYNIEQSIKSDKAVITSEKDKLDQKNKKLNSSLNSTSKIHFIKRHHLKQQMKMNESNFKKIEKEKQKAIQKQNKKITKLKK